MPYARNARTHSEAQLQQIAESIRQFGFNGAILIDQEGSILAGHGRVLAAQKLGISHLPVIVVSHLNEVQKRAFRLADNQLALNAGWDEELLSSELKALAEQNMNLEVTGFDDEELKRLLAKLESESDLDPDEAPEAEPDVVSHSGDLWIAGTHRILCADGTKVQDLERLLVQPSDMVFTDFPYNVAYEGKTARKLTLVNDDLGTGFSEFLQSACRALLKVNNGAVYLCMSSGELHRLYSAFTEAGGHWSTFIIWAKNPFTLGRSNYQRQFEPILYGWREGHSHYWCGKRDQGDVWMIDKPFRNDIHPTMKPVELVERAIRNSSRAGEIVLDPFAGSGSTLIACQRTGRAARLIEIDPRYVDVIVRRWQEYTGQAACLEGDGRTFAEVSQSGLSARDEKEAA